MEYTEREQNILSYWQKREPFDDIDLLPEYPLFNEKTLPHAKELQEYVTKRFIELGAIPKKSLIVGHVYAGHCRNAHEAVWKGECFEYMRHKFGCTYPEEINHFEDDDGYDVYVPLKDITETNGN